MKCPLLNQQGFTLLEAMISILILSFGILAAAAMQGNAIRASTTAYNRTGADNVAMAVFEAMQDMPYKGNLTEKDDPAECRNAPYLFGTTGGKSNTGLLFQNLLEKKPLPTKEMYRFEKEEPGFEALTERVRLTPRLGGKDGEVCDQNGACYQLFWSVQSVRDEEAKICQAANIRLFMAWDTPYGMNHLVYTTTRYNNQAEK